MTTLPLQVEVQVRYLEDAVRAARRDTPRTLLEVLVDLEFEARHLSTVIQEAVA